MNTKQKVLGLKVGLVALIFLSFFMTAFKADLGFMELKTSINDLDGGGVIVFLVLVFAGTIGFFEYKKHNFTKKAYLGYAGFVLGYIILEVILQKADDDFGVISLGFGTYLLFLLPIVLLVVIVKEDLVTEFIESKFPESDQPKQQKPKDSFDEIKRLKELLDIGAITQEEFDLKKQELL